MLQSIAFFSIILSVYGAIEYYGWTAVRTAFQPENLNRAKWIYWGFSAVLFLLFISYRPFLYKYLPKWTNIFQSFLIAHFSMAQDIEILV